jgi:predicted amidohydrolase
MGVNISIIGAGSATFSLQLIRVVDTLYGKIGCVICLNMDYPDFRRPASRQGVDIMLSGAIDRTSSAEGYPFHSAMASNCTIEEGFSLARAGCFEQYTAVDYQVRFWGAANHYTSGNRTVLAHLPIRGVRTLYSVL